MLRLLAEDRPSQINAIDSTTAPGTATSSSDNVDSTTEGTINIYEIRSVFKVPNFKVQLVSENYISLSKRLQYKTFF